MYAVPARPGTGAQRRNPTSGDITAETRLMFENAGSDVEPIKLIDPAGEIDDLCQSISASAEWDMQVSGMRRLMGLINGGALENQVFKHDLQRIAPGLEAAATNLRSALVKQACLTIAQLARALGPQFDTLGDFIAPLSTQLAHGTQIIAESCKFAIFWIVQNCCSRKVLLSIIELAGKRGPAQRAVAAESFGIIMNAWELGSVSSAWSRVEPVMVRLLADASQEVRAHARMAMKNLERNDATKFQRIMEKCDSRTRKAVNEAEAAPEMAKIAGRAPSAQPKMRQNKPKIKSSSPESPRRNIQRKAKVVDDVGLDVEKPKPVLKQPAKPKRSASASRSNIPVSQKRKDREFAANVDNRRVRIEIPEESEDEPIENPKPEFILESGGERDFLARLRGMIDEGETLDMNENLTDIAIGVVKCCVHQIPQIQIAALTILHDIIPPFSSHFEPSLPKLLNLLVHLIETGTPRCAATAQLILNDLPKFFDVNQLLYLAGRYKPSTPILLFVGKLVDEPEAALTNDELCMPLLTLASRFEDITQQNVSHTAAHIIIRIEEVNHDVVKQFCETLVGSEKDRFSDFIHRYLPAVSFEPVEIDVPRFDPKMEAVFRNKVLELSRTLSHKEWAGVRSRIYIELSEALFHRGNAKQLLLLISRIFETRGVSEYHKLWPGLLHQMKGDYGQLVDNIIVTILKETSAKELISSIQQQALSQDVAVAKGAINLIRRMISSVVQQEVPALLPTLFPILTRAFQNEAPEVRKAVVLCFVEIKVVAGTDVDQFLTQLSKSQQRLISVYYERRVQ